MLKELQLANIVPNYLDIAVESVYNILMGEKGWLRHPSMDLISSNTGKQSTQLNFIQNVQNLMKLIQKGGTISQPKSTMSKITSQFVFEVEELPEDQYNLVEDLPQEFAC